MSQVIYFTDEMTAWDESNQILRRTLKDVYPIASPPQKHKIESALGVITLLEGDLQEDSPHYQFFVDIRTETMKTFHPERLQAEQAEEDSDTFIYPSF